MSGRRNKGLTPPAAEGVYLLAFYKDGKHIGFGSLSSRGQAMHYCGWARNIKARLYHHLNGSGAKLVRAVVAAGYEARLVAVWEGESREFERKLKSRHTLRPFCPACRAVKAAQARGKGK